MISIEQQYQNKLDEKEDDIKIKDLQISQLISYEQDVLLPLISELATALTRRFVWPPACKEEIELLDRAMGAK